jgi:hypothetical protein
MMQDNFHSTYFTLQNAATQHKTLGWLILSTVIANTRKPAEVQPSRTTQAGSMAQIHFRN